MAKRVIILSALTVAIAVLAGEVVAADLCPALDPPKKEGEYDRRMTEETFGAKQLARGLHYLEEVLPRIIVDKPATPEDMIGYTNVMTTIKGHLLRQDALLRLAERDLIAERNQRGRASRADLAAANARSQEAKQRFCDYLKNALYSD